MLCFIQNITFGTNLAQFFLIIKSLNHKIIFDIPTFNYYNMRIMLNKVRKGMNQVVYNENGLKGVLYQRSNDYIYLCITEKYKRIRKSLDTKDYCEALRKFVSVIENYKNGVHQYPSFKKVCDDFLETVSSKQREDYGKRLKSVFLKEFQNTKINEINETTINEFIFNRLKKAKPQTINRDVSVLKQVFKYARKKSYIKEVPQIERLKEDKKKREAFTEHELEELLTLAKERIGEINNAKNQYDRTILYYYMRFLLAAGIRTGEALSIRFSGIDKDTAKLTKSKTKIRDIVLNADALKVIEELKETYRNHNIPVNDGSYLFLNYKGEQIKSLKKSFNSLMLETSMAKTIGKNELTLYSFRHTYITRAIKNKVPLTTIALQCGTSVEMIQKNYNHLTIHSVKDELK